jgi:PAP2 superfamily protein
MRTDAICAALAMAAVLRAGPASAQTPASASDTSAVADSVSQSSSDSGMLTRFVRDVGSDYKNFFSVETALWLGGGGAAALVVHQADESIKDSVLDSNASMPGGDVYGSQYFQVPVAVAWWAIASAAGSQRHAETGRDLLRAQIAVASWTYAIKLAANRTRPNGESHSLPSGHASASFATAMVLQDHYGWKVGLPAFLAAGYTAASRVVDNQHWTSDVVFGAAVGIACARTVTIKFRESRVSMAPVVTHKNASLIFSVVRPQG